MCTWYPDLFPVPHVIARFVHTSWVNSKYVYLISFLLYLIDMITLVVLSPLGILDLIYLFSFPKFRVMQLLYFLLIMSN